jgi:hypothetical protein
MACSGYNRNYDYSLIYVLLAVVVICGLNVASPFINRAFDRISADFMLRELEAGLQDVQHPAGAERVSARSLKGNFAGGEQGWDLFAGEIYRYDGDRQAVLSKYAQQEVGGRAVETLFLEDGRLPAGTDLPDSLSDIEAWGLPADAGQASLYLVYVAVVDYKQ